MWASRAQICCTAGCKINLASECSDFYQPLKRWPLFLCSGVQHFFTSASIQLTFNASSYSTGMKAETFIIKITLICDTLQIWEILLVLANCLMSYDRSCLLTLAVDGHLEEEERGRPLMFVHGDIQLVKTVEPEELCLGWENKPDDVAVMSSRFS